MEASAPPNDRRPSALGQGSSSSGESSQKQSGITSGTRTQNEKAKTVGGRGEEEEKEEEGSNSTPNFEELSKRFEALKRKK